MALILLKLVIFFLLLVGLGTRRSLWPLCKSFRIVLLVYSTYFPFIVSVMARAPRRPKPGDYFNKLLSKFSRLVTTSLLICSVSLL